MERKTPWIVAALWWVATIAILVVLDDMLFGPFFWAIALHWGSLVAVVIIFVVYVPAQVALVRQSMSDAPVALARPFLKKLDLGRRNVAIEHNESMLRHRIVGVGSALAFSLLLGGVIPCLVLLRRGYPRKFIQRLSIATSVLYAAEYALLHGVLPGIISSR